jgi:phosphoserine phosphatase
MRRLSRRCELTSSINLPVSLQVTVCGFADDEKSFRQEIREFADHNSIDISVLDDEASSFTPRLIVFDMDSTLIQTEVIVELASRAGVGELVSDITESAMRGELDFKESFAKRLGLLKGLDESVLKDIAANLPLTEGVQRMAATLKSKGYKLAIVSGGFEYFGNHLKELLNFDYVFANVLEIVDGKVTGRVCGDVVDGNRKAELLQELAKKEGLALAQTVAVGDGANDLPMIALAGMGVAFHAKPIVKAAAEHSLSNVGLDGLLYLLSIKEKEFIEA